MVKICRIIISYSQYYRPFCLLIVIMMIIRVIVLRKTSSDPIPQIHSIHQQIKNSSINDSVQPEVLLIYIYANTHPYAVGNLKYFVENAVRENDGADYYFILQNVDNKTVNESELPALPRRNAHYIQHENICFDFGTAGWFLSTYTVGNPWLNQTSITNSEKKINLTQYKYFILINSSVRGPFFPPYYLKFIADYREEFGKTFHWYYVFTKRINEKVKLTGCTISCIPIPHVQSFVLVTDLIGMILLLKPFPDGSNIFKCPKIQIHASFDSEVPSSSRILEAGYMIDSLLTKYQAVNFNEQHNRLCNQHKNPYLDDNLDGVSLEPYEVVFVKYKDQPYLQRPRKRGELYERWTNDANKLNRSVW